jgi:hypothetical protein
MICLHEQTEKTPVIRGKKAGCGCGSRRKANTVEEQIVSQAEALVQTSEVTDAIVDAEVTAEPMTTIVNKQTISQRTRKSLSRKRLGKK